MNTNPPDIGLGIMLMFIGFMVYILIDNTIGCFFTLLGMGYIMGYFDGRKEILNAEKES